MAANWNRYAVNKARDLYQHDGSRYGSIMDDSQGVCVVYDSNPFRNQPARRQLHIEAMRKEYAEIGVSELAYADYPKDGRDKGYTYVMVLDAPPSQVNAIEEIRHRVWRTVGWDD